MATGKFTIDRSKWACGAYRKTQLLDYHGFRCCLGFYATACGVSDNDILREGEYADLLPSACSLLPKELVEVIHHDERADLYTKRVSRVHNQLITANDDTSLKPSQREHSIVELFASIGVTVEFTGEYPP
jgi:hypothetical protein